MMRACDVCVIVGGDHTVKDTKYCSLCDSWLCDDCRGRYDLRMIAALKKVGAAALEAIGLGS